MWVGRAGWSALRHSATLFVYCFLHPVRDYLEVLDYDRTVTSGGLLSFSVLISVSSVGADPGFHLRVRAVAFCPLLLNCVVNG